jgi:glutamate---cysteine ligase / carboxylate-amine ligase
VEIRPEVVRAARWRAARDGLEGRLVDLRGGGLVAAPDAVRALVARLRPELEEAGDWDEVAALAEAALARGSSAAEQRAAFTRGGMPAVLDLLVRQTAAV